jgi:two-component system, sensor histidine kinase PdtaS
VLNSVRVRRPAGFITIEQAARPLKVGSMPSPIQPKREVGLDLALAVIASASAPLVLLDGDLTIIAASTSFCTAFQIPVATVSGRRLDELSNGEWGGRQLASLLAATASGDAAIDAYEMDFVRAGQSARRLVIHAHKLEYGDPENVRLLLAVADVTDARLTERLRDELARDKDLLMQELQHRVANSLQIIASVLLQSARRVGSDETRTHLIDAHQRVMSIAALQKQLAVSRSGDVELSAYFTSLCRSIGASMIRDHKQLSLEVAADEGTASADVSVSLGLIVTELVINALKHAFPGNRAGTIAVEYRAKNGGWTLSVDDDGAGMPKGEKATPGLGTGIVTALAKQLKARVIVADNLPGTAVSVIYTPPKDGVKNASTPVPEPAI